MRPRPQMVPLIIAGVLFVIACCVIAAQAEGASRSLKPNVKGGKFEVTCKPGAIKDIAIDPIVSPGMASMHEHTFFGNKSLTASSTAASLQASPGATTCVVAADDAAYWVPVACNGPCVDAAGLPDMGMQTEPPIANVVKPVKIFAYYFGTQGVVEGQYPAGLQMATPVGGSNIGFSCGNGGKHSSPTRTLPYDCTVANGVRGTDGVIAIVKFPYCMPSSGKPVQGASTGACPFGDTTLGQVQIHVHYGLNATGFQTGSMLNFASGPASTFHGDWINGWNQTKLQALVSGCLDIDKDCGFLTASSPGPGG